MIDPAVEQAAWRHQQGCCACPCGQLLGQGYQRHHARIHDTKWARVKYPLFVDSAFNILLMRASCHMERPSFGKWPERRVQWYEYRMILASAEQVSRQIREAS